MLCALGVTALLHRFVFSFTVLLPFCRFLLPTFDYISSQLIRMIVFANTDRCAFPPSPTLLSMLTANTVFVLTKRCNPALRINDLPWFR